MRKKIEFRFPWRPGWTLGDNIEAAYAEAKSLGLNPQKARYEDSGGKIMKPRWTQRNTIDAFILTCEVTA